MSEAQRLVLDVSAEYARALHRIVRSMHDGHCPTCGFLGPAEDFWELNGNKGHQIRWESVQYANHECPACGFMVTYEEGRDALAAFRPHLQDSVAIFEKWRQSRKENGL